MELDYLGRVVEKALLQNPAVAHYADEWGERVTKEPAQLLNLDQDNRALVASELGATDAEFQAFLKITKAIYNGGKCEKTPV